MHRGAPREEVVGQEGVKTKAEMEKKKSLECFYCGLFVGVL